MAYSGLRSFVRELEENDEIQVVDGFVNPELEIAEITDRITKSSGKALLFNNNGTEFPLLINAYGSDRRMAMALGRRDLDNAADEIEKLAGAFAGPGGNILSKLKKLPSLLQLAGYLPSRRRGKGDCQRIIHNNPDLTIFPVLKCWPYDGGRYITLPVVHTRHPVTGRTNAGMYRMQVLDKQTTAMHWQRHKTGANHFDAWKAKGMRMPVSVSLGGDPVYAYAATAPLPEGIDEFILAGFLRRKRVRMVRCLSNDLYVPEDADIVLEGYVDPEEELFMEGPFGDHTGFYSLADLYPKFHITCITHRKNALYPATIVGIPPQEDAWIARATEKIFLPALKLALLPEVEDFHMPWAGVAHNLLIVRIRKSYPGQGMKVIGSLLGAGQMMFSKYLIVVSGDTDIRDYRHLAAHILENADMVRDLVFSRGPMDVLDHSSDAFSFGGKLGIDATEKLPEEKGAAGPQHDGSYQAFIGRAVQLLKGNQFEKFNLNLISEGIPIAIVSVERKAGEGVPERVINIFSAIDTESIVKLVIVVDHSVAIDDLHMVAWQVLGNSDPQRDHSYIGGSTLLIDGTVKAFREGGFPRRWPNVVCSDSETISAVSKKWNSLGLGELLQSPSESYTRLVIGDGEDVRGDEGK